MNITKLLKDMRDTSKKCDGDKAPKQPNSKKRKLDDAEEEQLEDGGEEAEAVAENATA